MRRTIGFLIRISMWVSAKLGSHWFEIARDWHNVVDMEFSRVFESEETLEDDE